MSMITKNHARRTFRRFTMLASGVWLFQSGGCVIDDALANQLINLALQALLGGLGGTTI